MERKSEIVCVQVFCPHFLLCSIRQHTFHLCGPMTLKLTRNGLLEQTKQEETINCSGAPDDPHHVTVVNSCAYYCAKSTLPVWSISRKCPLWIVSRRKNENQVRATKGFIFTLCALHPFFYSYGVSLLYWPRYDRDSFLRFESLIMHHHCLLQLRK